MNDREFNEVFEPIAPNDKNIVSISLAEAQGKFILEIQATNTGTAVELEGQIGALKRIYEMDTPKKQNFSSECDEAAGTIKLVGNLFNAMNFLKTTELISAKFAETILADSRVTRFLEKTKGVILPENQGAGEAASADESDSSALTPSRHTK